MCNLNAAGPEENGVVAIATSMNKLSRRQLLDGSIGIGALLLTARIVVIVSAWPFPGVMPDRLIV